MLALDIPPAPGENNCSTWLGEISDGNPCSSQGSQPENDGEDGNSSETNSSLQTSEGTAGQPEIKKLLGKGKPGYFKCAYCAKKHWHEKGAPFPKYCILCEKEVRKIEKDKINDVPSVPTYKTYSAFKHSGHTTTENFSPSSMNIFGRKK